MFLFVVSHYAPVVETTGYVFNIEMKRLRNRISNIARGFNHGKRIERKLHYEYTLRSHG